MVWEDAASCFRRGDVAEARGDDVSEPDARHVTFAEFCEASDGTSEFSASWNKTFFDNHFCCRISHQVW